MQEEREAHYSPKKPNVENAKKIFNQGIGLEIHLKGIRYKNDNNLAFFDKMITHGEVLCKKGEDGEYQIREVFS